MLFAQLSFGRRHPMEPSAPCAQGPSRPAGFSVVMKIFLALLTALVAAHLIGSLFFGLYLHMKMDKVAGEISAQEDGLLLRRLQKCRQQRDSGTGCGEILSAFQDLQVQPSTIVSSSCSSSSGCSTSPWNAESSPSTDGELHAQTWKCCFGAQRVPKWAQRCHHGLHKGEKMPSASMHLAGLKINKKSSVLQWNRTAYGPSDAAFSIQGGKLRVAKGGRYYIYAQVSFCSKTEPHAPFSVHLYLNLPSELDQLLLRGVGTYSSSDDLCGLQSIHLGRIAELQAGHAIFVNVTDLSKVNYNHGNTYFGMFEVS